MSDTPLYLSQGSLVLVFPDQFRALATYKECLDAFETNGQFREFKIKTKEELSPGILSQPQKPWLIREHNCVICGLAELPDGFHSDPDCDNAIVSPFPPIPVGSHISMFGLTTIRLQAAHIVPELILIARAS